MMKLKILSALQRMFEGDTIVVLPGGQRCEFVNSGVRVPWWVVGVLADSGYIGRRPGYPLYDAPPKLTPIGAQAAASTYERKKRGGLEDDERIAGQPPRSKTDQLA